MCDDPVDMPGDSGQLSTDPQVTLRACVDMISCLAAGDRSSACPANLNSQSKVVDAQRSTPSFYSTQSSSIAMTTFKDPISTHMGDASSGILALPRAGCLDDNLSNMGHYQASQCSQDSYSVQGSYSNPPLSRCNATSDVAVAHKWTQVETPASAGYLVLDLVNFLPGSGTRGALTPDSDDLQVSSLYPCSAHLSPAREADHPVHMLSQITTVCNHHASKPQGE